MSSPDQLEKLNRLIAALVPANPFYTRKLVAALGERGHSFSSLAEFTTRVPFTTKQELLADQLANPPFGTNLTYPLERYTRFTQTSGSTGEPLRWLDTNESWDWMVDCWCQVFRAAGVKSGDRIYFAFSFGPFLGFWLAFDAGAKLGCLCIPGGGLSSAARRRAVIENEVTVLCCTPTYALHLAGEPTKVKTIIVAGEPGGSIPATRAAISAAWNGAQVFDHHGMTEIGPVTYEWPDRPGCLAVMEDAFIAEVIDAAGRPADEGELVLTNLGRTGSPLLRYRTGDRVKKSFIEGHLVLEGGILGRTDDMIIVRGVNVYPTAVEAIVRRHPEIIEYRVEITERQSLAELCVIIEPAVGCPGTADLAGRLEAEFRDAFALRIPVTVAAPGTLPRFELKAKRWVRCALRQ